MSARLQIHLTVERVGGTIFVNDDMTDSCVASGPTIEDALQGWIDERRARLERLKAALAEIDLPVESA